MAPPVQGGQPPPPSDTSSSPPRNISTSSASSTAPASPPAASPVTPSGVRAPNAAKRVPRNPADELRSAVNRDVLRKEAKKAAAYEEQPSVQRNVSAPVLPTARPLSPPTSPTMTSASNLSATRADPHAITPRNASIDSTVSSASNASARTNGPVGAYRSPPPGSRPDDVASLIADAGSPEAALQKVVAERNQAASHNAQLWRLVEKQRTMILGLNKDLEKALKEKEKYRKRLKDQLVQSESAPTLITANQQLEALAQRGGSESPAAADISPPATAINTRGMSIDNRKVSDTSDGLSYGPGRSDTPLDASNAPSSVLPATPQSVESPNQISRDIDIAAAAAISAQENRVMAQSPTKSPTLSQGTGSPFVGSHAKTPSISSTASNPVATGSFSNMKNAAVRKAPPAPLKLSSQKAAAPPANVTNNIIDPSDSEYEEDPESARADQAGRGRRKTREDDDRERDTLARHELEPRALMIRDKTGKSGQPTASSETSSDLSSISAAKVAAPEMIQDQSAAERQLPQPVDPAVIHAQQNYTSAYAPLPKSSTAPSLLTPGLPMSPRPVDRPSNSPMPRPPNKALNSIPMSPKAGVVGLPLSPRAPRQPIPMPPQVSLPITSPHLVRAEGYQVTQPASSSFAKQAKPITPGSPEYEHKPSPSADGLPMSPGEIYQGLVTDEYPELLLPPNALPSIFVKTASSRMKPSRQSFLAPKAADDNPVFTLAVYQRAEKKQLWRVEKTFAALAQLDEEIKAACRFRERVPDKALFNGHAPAKIDARRAAIDTYFHRMLDSVTDDIPAMIICRFLSSDAIGADSGDYFGGSVDLRADTPLNKKPRREGYLTKRGKNFGGWKARYFVLDGPLLKYYDSQGGAQLGSIKLQNAQIGKQSNPTQVLQEDEENQFRHAFLILEPKKRDSTSLVRHVLCAESDDERDIWVDALLQYVDYREIPEDLVSKAGLSAKMDLGPPRSPRLQKSLNDLRPSSRSREAAGFRSDELRAVGYSDTVAGEAPIMGPPSPRIVESPSPPHDENFGPAFGLAEQSPVSHPNISGPSNPQVISNAGDWGMKPAPTPRDKDKKRSIFAGFRGRSSSDYGPNEKPPSAGLQPHDQGAVGPPLGPPRAAFGAPLEDAVRYARPSDVSTDLPAVVYRCIEYLVAQNAVAEEGIFRLSGSNTVIKGLKDRFNNEGDVNLLADGQYYDIHAVASLLKLYLRELPSSILTRELHLEFLSCQEKQGREKIVVLNALVGKLPRPNRALLDALSAFLQSIVNNAEINKMNIRNVGIVFAPTLNVPAPLISSFVEDQAAIFGPPLDQPPPPPLASTLPPSAAAPTDLRSPRKQMFTDLPTPAYNQTSFQPIGYLNHDAVDGGMIPVHSAYPAYQVAPQGEGGFSSLNDALKAPTPAVYNSLPGSARDLKARRRESAIHGSAATGVPKKSSMSQLREEERRV